MLLPNLHLHWGKRLMPVGILILFSISVYSQTIDTLVQSNGLQMSFVKNFPKHDGTQPLFFNSVKIDNISKDTITFKPNFDFPNNWEKPKFVFLPKSVTLAPNQTKYIPFKVNVPKSTIGDKRYSIKLHAEDKDGENLATIENSVYIPIKRDWKIDIVDNDLILLPPDSNKIKFVTRLQNLGNTTETISLQMAGITKSQVGEKINLQPGEDTIISFQADYKEEFQFEGARTEYLRVIGTTNEGIKESELPVVRFKNKYNGANARFRPHGFRLNFRDLSALNQDRIGISFAGSVDFSKEESFYYVVNNSDILNIQQFTNLSNVNLGYFSKKFELEVGNIRTYGEEFHLINTMSGRTPTKNGFNGYGGMYKYHFSPNHVTKVYSARNFRNSITNASVGHSAKFGNNLAETVLSYTLDLWGQKSWKIASFNTQTEFLLNHNLDFQTNIVEVTHHLESIGNEDLSHLGNKKFTESSYNYRLTYNGRPTENTIVYFHQSAYSPRYPNRLRGNFNMVARVDYYLPTWKHKFNIQFRYFKRPDKLYIDAVPQVNIASDLYEGRIMYAMPLNDFFKVEGGFFSQNFNAYVPSLISNEIYPYNASYNGVMANFNVTILDQEISIRGFYGIGQVEDFFSTSNGKSFEEIAPIPSQQVTVNFYTNRLDFGAVYNKGPNNIITNYESFIDDDGVENLALFYAYNKFLFKRIVYLRFSGSLRQNFTLKRASMNQLSAVALNLKRGWNIELSNNSNLVLQTSPQGVRFDNLTQNSLSLNKDFSVNLKNKNYDLEIVCFEDVNNNGVMDEDEKGIPDIEITATPAAIGVERDRKFDRFKYSPIRLFTDKEGSSFFNAIVQGNHTVKIKKILAGSSNYVSTLGNYISVDLDEDRRIEIPFKKAKIIKGKITIQQGKLDKSKLSPGNIRVTATSKDGQEFKVLSNADGSFSIPVPLSESYTVRINHPFDKEIKLYPKFKVINFIEEDEVTVDFKFVKKARKINFN